MIKFRCSQCKEPMEAPESLIGDCLVCPKCKASTRVPQKELLIDKSSVLSVVCLVVLIILILLLFPFLTHLGDYPDHLQDYYSKSLNKLDSVKLILYFILLFLVALVLTVERFRVAFVLSQKEKLK